MCAYNRINGDWACENEQTLKTMLKGYYNFSGFVAAIGEQQTNDFTTEKAIRNGLDIEMPRPKKFSLDAIQQGLDAKEFTMGI